MIRTRDARIRNPGKLIITRGYFVALGVIYFCNISLLHDILWYFVVLRNTAYTHQYNHQNPDDRHLYRHQKLISANYKFRNLSTDNPDWEIIALRVLFGISFPGWLGITTLLWSATIRIPVSKDSVMPSFSLWWEMEDYHLFSVFLKWSEKW